MNFSFDADLLTGLFLALTRVGAFVVASPLLARLVPAPGRLAVATTLGLFLAEPVRSGPTIGDLAVLAAGNAAIGLVLGFLTGLLFELFGAAGALVDLTSGLSSSAFFDPSQGRQAAVFSRLFNLVGLALFYALGGVEVLVRGLATSVQAIPLDGRLGVSSDLADLTLRLTGRLLVLAAELALPLLSALFLSEVALGLAARLAPQANVFVLGLSVKLLLTFAVVSASLALFPGAVDSLFPSIADTFRDVLRGLAPQVP